MPTAAAGTIAAKRALPYARVLARSFAEHHPAVPFFVLLTDEVQGCFAPEDEPFELLLLRDLPIANLPGFCFGHSEHALSYASTPYLLEALLDRAFSRVLFLKQESLVVGDQGAALSQLDTHPIVLTPHLLDPLSGMDRAGRELNILQSGVFNAGFLGVSDAAAARRFLHWWQDRLVAHCRHAIGEGMHYEQRWLDLVPVFFEDAFVLRDPGANIGHWNLPERAGEDAQLFRFSGFDPEHRDRVTRYSSRVSMAELGATARVFAAYAEALYLAGWNEARQWPYAYECFANGVAIPDLARELYLQLGNAAERFGNPFETARPDSYFAWLNEPLDGGANLTRLWAQIYMRRPDLQVAFPDVHGGDGEAFMVWAAEVGIKEHQIPDAFVER